MLPETRGDVLKRLCRRHMDVATTIAYVAVRTQSGPTMDEFNGRMIACQLLITGLIARVANNSPDPLRFLTDFRDEISAVVTESTSPERTIPIACGRPHKQTVDELFSLMKPPSID